MKTKKKIIISCSIVLVAILLIFGVWTVKSGCVNYLLLDELQGHEELLNILIKPTEKERFLSRLDDLGIRYFITKEESKDVVYFKDGFVEIENGEINSWSYYNSNVRIPAIPEEIVEKILSAYRKKLIAAHNTLQNSAEALTVQEIAFRVYGVYTLPPNAPDFFKIKAIILLCFLCSLSLLVDVSLCILQFLTVNSS